MSHNVEAMDEQLTAYLDGELNALESAELERRLVDDEPLRLRLAELRKTFELLDDLPETPHNQQFTQSTIEMVVADLRQSAAVPQLQLAPVKKPWYRGPKLLLWMLLSLCIGTACGTGLAFFQVQSELHQLSLIADLTGLQDTQELNVIVELAKDKELFDFLSDHLSDRAIPDMPTSVWQRPTWVRSLNPVQLTKLDSNRELLQKLTAQDRSRLEAVETQLESRDDAQRLHQAIRIIGHVMDHSPSNRRTELDGLTADQRVRLLREQLCYRAALLYASEIPAADTAALEDWSRRHFIPSLMALNAPRGREFDIQSLLTMLYARHSPQDGFRLDNQDELIVALADSLSPLGRKMLEGVDRTDQLDVISTWLIPGGMDSTQRLVDTFDKVRRDAREELELVDPNQSKRLLKERMRRPTGTRNR